MKNNKINLLICGFSIIVLITYILLVDGIDNIISSILSINPIWLLVGLLGMLVYWWTESHCVYIFCRLSTKKARYWDVFNVTLLGQFFNCITPFASGGQPLQAYYMSKHKIPLSSGLTALLSRFIVYQFVLTIYCAIILIFKFSYFSNLISNFVFVALIGFTINLFVLMFLISIGCSRRVTKKIMTFFIYAGHKIKLVKKPWLVTLHMYRTVDSFNKNFKHMQNHIGTMLKGVILTIIQLTAYFALPYFIYRGFGLSEHQFFIILSAQALILMISSFIPTPGALGCAELSFALIFTSFFPTKFINIAILIWRLLTFYLPILVGIILMPITNKRIARREKEELAEAECS